MDSDSPEFRNVTWNDFLTFQTLLISKNYVKINWYKKCNMIIQEVAFGEPGWLSQLSAWFWLGSWSHGLRGRVPHGALHWQCGACLGFSLYPPLPLPHMLSLSLSQNKLYINFKKEKQKEWTDFPFLLKRKKKKKEVTVSSFEGNFRGSWLSIHTGHKLEIWYILHSV